MLSNLSDLLMSRVEPTSATPQIPVQQTVAPEQSVVPAQAQYLQSSDKGKSKKIPQAVLDWLNQMENQTGYFAENQPPIKAKFSQGAEYEAGPVWGEYKTKLGAAKILEGMRLPDGTIDTSHPDVGLVDYGASMNPSGAVQDKTRMSRATKNEAGNWVYRNPVNPEKTHEYLKVDTEQPKPKKGRELIISAPWSTDSWSPEKQIEYYGEQQRWQKYFSDKDKAKKK